MSTLTLDDAAGEFPGGWAAYQRYFPNADPAEYVQEYGSEIRPRLTVVSDPEDPPPSPGPAPALGAWETRPVSLTPSEGPRFPVQVLPERVRSFVESVAAGLQVPVDLVASLSLAAVATAVAGKAEVRPKPGWTEPLNLWVINVLPPAARKSAVMSAVPGRCTMCRPSCKRRPAPRSAKPGR